MIKFGNIHKKCIYPGLNQMRKRHYKYMDFILSMYVLYIKLLILCKMRNPVFSLCNCLVHKSGFF